MVQRDPMGPEFQPYADGAMAGRPSTREPSAFGKRLAALREQKGVTQSELADRLGVSQQLVAYYERRALSPSLDFVEQLATALDVQLTELVGDDSSKPRRLRPGPVSQLEVRFERLRQLPRKKQQLAMKMIDTLLDNA
jgi:transcriptional regulator with XRE-family HTH domain